MKRKKLLAYMCGFAIVLCLFTGCFNEVRVAASGKVQAAAPGEAGLNLTDGDYACGVSLVGGSGKATVTNPCLFTVADGQAFARLEWSSSHYDYMIVDGVKYLPVNEEGNSTFEIPIKAFDQELTVIADTTAMTTAHEVEYAITFFSDQIIDAKDTPMARARYSVYMAGVIVLICMAESARKKYVKKQHMKNMR